MPSVQEELAALRKSGTAKARAAKLKDASGLSTPEREEAATTGNIKQNRTATYSKEAKEALKDASKALDQDLDFQMQQIAKKKDDIAKKNEASQNLHEYKLSADGKPAPKPEAPQDDVPSLEPSEEIPKVEEIPDINDIPELEAQTGPVDPAQQLQSKMAGTPRIQNRAEKKARKFLQKLGMKQVPGILRATLKMGGRQGTFIIQTPDVFEKNGSYIVFGEARQGGGPGIDPNQDVQQQAAQAVTAAMPEPKVVEAGADEGVTVEELDETGVEAKDIGLVISQAGCSRAQAVKALKENDGDLVNAIMSITN